MRKCQEIRSSRLLNHQNNSNYHWYIGKDNRARLCDCFREFALKKRLGIINGFRAFSHKPRRQEGYGI